MSKERGFGRRVKHQSGNGPAGPGLCVLRIPRWLYASAYLQAEMEARTSQLGVWRFVQEYPWELRKSLRK